MTKLTEGELIERVKKILFLKGTHSSQVMTDVMKDLALLSKPNNKVLNKKNEILPFEDPASLEFLTSKNDCGLFTFASHSKKRPNNLVLGRVFDGHLLDMFEFGVDEFISIDDFKGDKKAIGSKPMMVFLGDQWEVDAQFMSIQNLLLDYFRGFKPEKINLQGIDHVITCAVADSKIFIRGYSVNYKKSGSEVPELGLKPMGPFMDLSLRRTQPVAPELMKVALKKPKLTNVPTKQKNVERSNKGDKMGRIHMKKQNLDKLGGRRSVALRSSGGKKKSEKSEGVGAKRSRSDGDVKPSKKVKKM